MTTHSSGSPREPTVTFWGAARSVTGSMHLLEVGDHKVLLDCGKHRLRRDEPPPSASFPFDPAELDAVVLSHAHIDHCGALPQLVRQGFSGPIYCSPATRDLVELILTDSARFQEEEAFVASVLGRGAAVEERQRRHHSDAFQAALQCVAVPYDRPVEILPDVEVRLVDAGHILGSAMVSLRVNLGFAERSLTFTGDLGRRGVPFLHEFGPMPEAGLVISESTYGGGRHQTLDEMTDAVSEVVRRTAERGGKLLIPAFSLGRTQLVVHYLSKWVREGRIPKLPIWVDGSLAPDMAEIHRDHAHLLIPDADLHGPGVEYIRSREESEIASTERGPAVIIAPSGMCDGGRIMHHLKQHIDDPRCTILLVSYQAPHTLGRQLLEPQPTVRFHGRAWNLWAEVVEVDGFSGHAGHDDLLAAIGPLAGRAKKVRLVHGEIERAEVLARALGEAGFGDVAVPERGETVTLA